METDKNKSTVKIENEAETDSASTFGGYSFVLGYRQQASRSEEAERDGMYSALLAMVVIFTVGVLCIAAVIIFDILADPFSNSLNSEVFKSSGAITNGNQNSAVPYTAQQIEESCSAFTVGVSCNGADGTRYGTGIVITSDGYIVTSNEVVENSNEVKAVLSDGRSCSAKVVGRDSVREIAVIKIDETGLEPAAFATETCSDGDNVTAFSVFSQYGTVTDTVSGKVFTSAFPFTKFSGTENESTFNVISTDILSQNDMCGAPLVNSEGKIVGIMFGCGEKESGSYAIPTENVLPAVNSIINAYQNAKKENTEILPGVFGTDISAETASKYNLPGGVLITGIECCSEAENAGFAEGDIIVCFDGVSVMNISGLKAELSDYSNGDSVTVKVYRKGVPVKITVIL